MSNKLILILLSILTMSLFASGQGSKEEGYVYKNYNFEDPSGKLGIKEIASPKIFVRFDSAIHPKNTSIKNLESSYWVRFKIRNPKKEPLVLTANFLFESIALYVPLAGGGYEEKKIGLVYPFKWRDIRSLDPTFIIPGSSDDYYYVRLRSNIHLGLAFELMPLKEFYNMSIVQYMQFGIFFGIVVIIGFYNLILFLLVKERAYVFYGMYILSFCLFSLVNWGFPKAFMQNVSFSWNYYFWTIPFCAMNVFLMLYAKFLLDTKNSLPVINQIINWLIPVRLVILVVSTIFDISFLSMPTIDLAILVVAYIAGVIKLRRGFKPAKFFVLGMTIIYLGYVIHSFHAIRFLPFNQLSFINVTTSGVVELFFFSFALADRFKVLKSEKEEANLKVINQYKENEILKDKVNNELEEKVSERTMELQAANERLEHQAREIERMNELLKEDNKDLQQNVRKLSKDRVMQKGVGFQEFLQIYPNEEACHNYLIDLKWKDGFACRKCGNKKFSSAKIPYARKCSRCNYIESTTSGTIFAGVKFPLVKAFYIVFLHSWGKELTVAETAKVLDLRSNTCWAFKKKVTDRLAMLSGQKKGDKLTQIILTESREVKSQL